MTLLDDSIFDVLVLDLVQSNGVGMSTRRETGQLEAPYVIICEY